MTSSPAIAATERRRAPWVDNLRVLVIAGVVVMHASTAYLGGADWYYTERTTSEAWSAVVVVPATLGAIFALAPLFLLAGWYSAVSLQHHGAGPFARSRLLRLGLPLLVFIYLVDPVAGYLGAVGEGREASLARYLRVEEAEAGPMWFVAALLVYSLAYAALRHARPLRPASPRALDDRVIGVAVVVLALTAWFAWIAWPLDDGDTFLNLRWGLWPQGAVLFGLGVYARENAGEWTIPADLTRRFGWTALAGVALMLAMALLAMSAGTLDGAPTGIGWSAAVFAVVYAVISVTSAVWMVEWSRRRLGWPGPVVREAGRASYATYVLHPLVLTVTLVAFAPLALPPEVKFVPVSLLAVPACFLAGWVVVRTPGARRVL